MRIPEHPSVRRQALITLVRRKLPQLSEWLGAEVGHVCQMPAPVDSLQSALDDTRRLTQFDASRSPLPGTRDEFFELRRSSDTPALAVGFAFEDVSLSGLTRGITFHVGGVYGLAIGRIFFAESAFHFERDASKIAFAELSMQLRARGFVLIDTRIVNPHTTSLGATEIPRDDFLMRLRKSVQAPGCTGPWTDWESALT